MVAPDFNSIKVQLEQYSSQANAYKALFQFHKGTIRTYGQYLHESNQADFNSIKVQLEQAINDLAFILSVFQFHKGTIRTKSKFKIL